MGDQQNATDTILSQCALLCSIAVSQSMLVATARRFFQQRFCLDCAAVLLLSLSQDILYMKDLDFCQQVFGSKHCRVVFSSSCANLGGLGTREVVLKLDIGALAPHGSHQNTKQSSTWAKLFWIGSQGQQRFAKGPALTTIWKANIPGGQLGLFRGMFPVITNASQA